MFPQGGPVRHRNHGDVLNSRKKLIKNSEILRHVLAGLIEYSRAFALPKIFEIIIL